MSFTLHEISVRGVLGVLLFLRSTPLLSFKGALKVVYKDIQITQVFLLKFST